MKDYDIYGDIRQASNVIYLLNGGEDVAKLWNEIVANNVCLVEIKVMDWNGNLSPWKAKKVFRQGEDFEGNADIFLKVLTKNFIPEIEINSENVQKRMLVGYSLAGLFAVYSCYQTDLFDRIAA